MTNCNKDPKILPDWNKVFVSRHEFLKLFGLGLSGVIGLIVTVPGVAFVVGYLCAPEPHEWISIGPVDHFQDGQTVDVVFHDPYSLPWEGMVARRSAWVRRKGDSFLAFAINCTHLGCPVRWEKEAELFLCPCHGGVFYSNGEVAAGPPPRPMHQYEVRVKNGQVEISVGPVLTQT